MIVASAYACVRACVSEWVSARVYVCVCVCVCVCARARARMRMHMHVYVCVLFNSWITYWPRWGPSTARLACVCLRTSASPWTQVCLTLLSSPLFSSRPSNHFCFLRMATNPWSKAAWLLCTCIACTSLAVHQLVESVSIQSGHFAHCLMSENNIYVDCCKCIIHGCLVKCLCVFREVGEGVGVGM